MKMKYKVGQKVRIKSLDWYNLHKRPLTESVDLINGPNFIKEMSCFCNKIMTIGAIKENVYLMEEDDYKFDWTDDMIDGVEETKQEFFEKVSNAIKNYYKERPCRDCGPGNGCDDCRDCEDGKRNWEMWNEVKKLKDFYEYKFHTNYDEDKKVFENKNKPKFKPDDIVDTNDNLYGCVTDDITFDEVKNTFKYYVSFIVDGGYYYEYQLKPHIKADKEGKINMGEVSDGYHTFNELYDYRALYNAAFFNSLAVYVENMGYWDVDYDVHKSKKHSDGEECFGGGWFVVMAELPTGQISNHYPMKDWDLFHIPEKEKANKWDGHTSKDVAERIREFLTPKPKYPTTYKECCEVLNKESTYALCGLPEDEYPLFDKLIELKRCRDAYWKIAGEEMELGKPWNPTDSDYITGRYCIFVCEGKIICNTPAQDCILTFPTAEMRAAFYENFKNEIEQCKELL